MKKNIVLSVLMLVVLGAAQPRSSPPNIVVILVDDLGFGDLACQGASDMKTPYLDTFKSEGLTLNNFYANCTVCSPSRAALLTGRYPDLVGVPGVIRQTESNTWGNLSEDAILLPSVLKKRGYESAIIGKWHLGLDTPNTPNERGFDYFKGFLGDMMDDYWDHRRGGINWMRENEKEIDPKGHATDLFTDWALEYLEKKEQGSPFFLYLAYNAPHFPIQPPKEWLEKVKLREPQLSDKRAKNVAFIEHLDFSIGKVLSKLKSTGLDENTIVVFTSDNGGALRYEQSNGLLRGGKQDMYEGGIKVPAFIQWKGHIEPGSNSDRITLHMDLFPTLCKLAGTPVEHEIDGESFLQDWIGNQKPRSKRFLYWMRREGGPYGGQAYYAARYGDYKILQNTPYEPIQYFNVGRDPYENEEMGKEKNSTYNVLRKNLQSHIQKSGKVPWQ